MKMRFSCFAMIAILAGGCSQPTHPAAATAAPDTAVAGASSGDIPDTQAFVTYSPPSAYEVLFPEGWSRSQTGSTVTFTWHYDGEQITLKKPNAATPQAMAATFGSLSQPDPVTGRRVKLQNVTYSFTKGSRQAVLRLWAPQGSDNADQWRKISHSFRWK